MKKYKKCSLEVLYGIILKVSKRLLWCWETVCYSFFIVYLIRYIFFKINDEFIALLVCPTAILMLSFGKSIYSGKMLWKNYKWYQYAIPFVVLAGESVYGLLSNMFIFELAVGILITYILILLISISEKHIKRGSYNE